MLGYSYSKYKIIDLLKRDNQEVRANISKICQQAREITPKKKYYDPYGNLIDNTFLEIASLSLSNTELSILEVKNICGVDINEIMNI